MHNIKGDKSYLRLLPFVHSSLAYVHTYVHTYVSTCLQTSMYSHYRISPDSLLLLTRTFECQKRVRKADPSVYVDIYRQYVCTYIKKRSIKYIVITSSLKK